MSSPTRRLKIYFCGSIRGGRDDAALYRELIEVMNKNHKVLTEHIGLKELTSWGTEGLSDKEIHDQDMAWLRDSDCIVAEVTKPSLGVGYELGWGAALHKPVLCLYRSLDPNTRLSAMIAGCEYFQNESYSTAEEAKALIEPFLLKVLKRALF